WSRAASTWLPVAGFRQSARDGAATRSISRLRASEPRRGRRAGRQKSADSAPAGFSVRSRAWRRSGRLVHRQVKHWRPALRRLPTEASVSLSRGPSGIGFIPGLTSERSGWLRYDPDCNEHFGPKTTLSVCDSVIGEPSRAPATFPLSPASLELGSINLWQPQVPQ